MIVYDQISEGPRTFMDSVEEITERDHAELSSPTVN